MIWLHWVGGDLRSWIPPLLSTSAIILRPEVPKTTVLLVWKLTEQTPLASRAVPSHIIKFHTIARAHCDHPSRCGQNTNTMHSLPSYINQKCQTLYYSTMHSGNIMYDKNQSTHLSHHQVYSRHADSPHSPLWGFSEWCERSWLCMSVSFVDSLSFSWAALGSWHSLLRPLGPHQSQTVSEPSALLDISHACLAKRCHQFFF